MNEFDFDELEKRVLADFEKTKLRDGDASSSMFNSIYTVAVHATVDVLRTYKKMQQENQE